MEFTELFAGVAVVLVMITAFFALATTWNDAYGSSIAGDNETTELRQEVTTMLETGLVDRGLTYAESTQEQAGAGSEDTQQENMVVRAIKSIGLIDDLIGLIPALIKYAAGALGVPTIYWEIAQAIFWIIFSITLALLLLLGVRSLIP